MTTPSCAREIRWIFGVLALVCCFTVEGFCEEPSKVTLCQLESDPAAYNHRLVEVTGFASHGFENFSLFDPSCSSGPAVWLEYGGVAGSGTVYCCGVPADRRRAKELVVENVPIPLVDDERFREFDRLLQRPPDSTLHATVVGRFFAGRQVKDAAGISWGGYGHFGCCSLLAIQQVISVDDQGRKDLDYRTSADQPRINKAGCGFRDLLSSSFADLIEAQRKAELGQREWSLSDPQRVASDALARLLKIDEKSITGMKQTRSAQGRFVYEWHTGTRGPSYMVVVSRPYWLSFYAKGTKRIAWIPIAAYESSCVEASVAPPWWG